MDAKPARTDKVEHIRVADKDLQKQFEMLSKVKPKPAQGPVTKISYGSIISMNIRGEWSKKSSSFVPGVYRAQEWQQKGSDLTLNMYTKLPALNSKQEKEVEQILSKPAHRLNLTEQKFIEQYAKIQGNSAESKEIYRKKIVLLRGSDKKSGKKFIELLVFESKQPGMVIHQITLQGKGEQFEKYQPLFEDSLHTIDWGVSAGDLISR